MSEHRTYWLLLPKPVREFPADLTAVVGLVVALCLAVFVPGVNETPLRIVLGLPFALFLPGYAFISALFPEEGSTPEDEEIEELDEASRFAEGIDGLERVALSFGLSIAITPLIGLVLNFTPWGIRLVPVVLSISGFTIIASIIGAYRRWELPSEERFVVPYQEWLAAGRAELFQPDTRADAALNVILVLSVLLAVGSVGYAVAVPKQGEAFSEFYLLTEDEDGELVADNYPTEFTRGESKPLIVGIGNHEHERTEYTVIAELQRVASENNTTRVLEEEELNRFQVTLDQNETWHHPHTVKPQMSGERLRLQYFLYQGSAPTDPREATAYREVHLWVNVTVAS